ncbi:MAG: hypothetical protein AAB731_01345 [Patescibacteria group bacterium]
MTRQTELSLEDICAYLEQSRLSGECGACHGGALPYPPCLLVNELGVLAVNEGNKEAEAKLRDILDWEQDELRAIAYLCLTQVEKLDEETASALLFFAQKLENEDIMEWADEQFKRRN